jgi:hypothetical protein
METVKIDDILYIPSRGEYSTKYRMLTSSGVLILYNNMDDFVDTDFIGSDYGDGLKRCIDGNVRESVICKKPLFLNFKLDDEYKDITFHNEYEFIKYDRGGYFIRHRDRKRREDHSHTITFYPPQDVIGGELEMYVNDEKIIIPMSPDEWKCVIFPIEIEHESMPVISGIKRIIKGIGLKTN